MADESDDDTCDQIGQNSGEGNQAPEKPGDESTTHQDNAEHSPPVNINDTSLNSPQSHNGDSAPMNSKLDKLPTSAQPQSGESPPANSKDTPLTSTQSHNGENPPVNSKDTPLTSSQCHNGESPPMNTKDTPLTSTQSQDVENSLENNEAPHKESNHWHYAAIGIAAGAAAVVAAPLVLGAAGFSAVASGSAFALIKSVGVVGIGAARKSAAIGGISGGIAALGTKMFDMPTDIKLLICGCGSGAQTLAGIASSMQDTDVRLLTSSSLLAKRWNTAMDTNDNLEVIFYLKGKEPTSITSRPGPATNNPEDAMQDVDIVVFVLPAFAHEILLDDLKPYVKPGTTIVGLPGGPGFEFQVREVLGDVARKCTIMNFESSPWVCRITKFGVKCEVLGTKETLLGFMEQGEGVAPKKDPVSTLQYLLGPLPKLNVSGHPLGVAVMSTDAYLHTSILYCQWEGWDGKLLDEPPLFYNGLTESAANLLSSVSDEIVNIGRALELKTEADMSNVVHIHQWLVRRYPHDITDRSTLYKAIQTNAAYQGLKHFVKSTEDSKFMPDFTCRYMTEDIPYGLVVIRGIAEIVGVETPNIDKVLTWCQEKMGKEYLVNSKLQGKDVSSSRAPQRYGFTTLKSIL